MACKEMRLLAALLVATTAEAQTDGMVARYEIMTTSQFGLQKILFVYVHFNISPQHAVERHASQSLSRCVPTLHTTRPSCQTCSATARRGRRAWRSTSSFPWSRSSVPRTCRTSYVRSMPLSAQSLRTLSHHAALYVWQPRTAARS